MKLIYKPSGSKKFFSDFDNINTGINIPKDVFSKILDLYCEFFYIVIRNVYR